MPVPTTVLHLWRSGKKLVVMALGWTAFTLSRFDIGVTILSDEPGSRTRGPLGPRVVIFCHFDRQGCVRAHTRRYIEALCAEGLDMVFVTNSGHLAPSDLGWIRERAARIVSRRNVGYDFAAWRDGMAVSGLPKADTRLLLIANDSVYGPLRPLGPVLAQLDFDQSDLWSATDSWQHRFHLQSFFVAFGPTALRHDAFVEFWGSVRNVRSKWWVVTQYELGLSRAFISQGLRCRALWPYTGAIDGLRRAALGEELSGEQGDDDLPSGHPRVSRAREPFAEALYRNSKRALAAALQHVPLNPTADLWQILLAQGCPFIKRELLQRNPSHVPDVAAWPSLIGGIDNAALDVIFCDLERSLKNRSP
jgi:hypothetical protein